MDTSEKREYTPPRVPIVLRVGVTGHRPDASKRDGIDIPAARSVIAQILGIVNRAIDGVADARPELFAHDPCVLSNTPNCRLRVISALASGADQWVADEAVKMGLELQCALPFGRQEYRKDFADPADLAEYERLLGMASAVMEMDGKVENGSDVHMPDGRNYEAVGRAIVDQSDLLIALWDGKPAKGRGGTTYVVQEAVQRGIPIVWIPWGFPTTWSVQLPVWRLVEQAADLRGDEERLVHIVRELLLPPTDAKGDEGGDDLRQEYFREKQKRGTVLQGWWTLFRNIMCGDFVGSNACNTWKALLKLQWFKVDGFVDSFKAQAASEWREKQTIAGAPIDHPLPVDIQSWADIAYLQHYAWANGLSVYYGNLYRSTFLVNFVMGAFAVFLALVSIGTGIVGHGQTLWIACELLVILGILGLMHLGRHGRWHQRWIDYRTLAERLRIARFTSLIGGGGPQVLHAGHLSSYGNPLHTWMHWHHRAVERAAGLPTATFTREYLLSCQEFWRESLLENQRLYHKETAARFSKLDRRLHHGSDFLFVSTLVACLLHLAHLWIEGDAHFDWIPQIVPGWLTVLSACLPALGAAFAAIRSQAETQRLAQRSRAMEEALEAMQIDLASESVRDASLDSVRLRLCLDRVNDLMVREMQDWRVVFQDRPLSLPV